MKIAILTNFKTFNFGYSLTGLVFDQIVMLKNYGHEIHLFIGQISDSEILKFLRITEKQQVKIVKETNVVQIENIYFHKYPFNFDLSNYKSKNEISNYHIDKVNMLSEKLLYDLSEIDLVFTHDWIFTGWNLPFALALQKIAEQTRNIYFYHWIHSIPSGRKDWWDLNKYGHNHKIIFPNNKDSNKVAYQFKTDRKNVIAIPHIKDLRTWFEFSPVTNEIINSIPNFFQKDIIQVYPASTDRMEAKRVPILCDLFSHFKNKRNLSVCLLIINQNGDHANVEKIKKYSRLTGLFNDDFILTSTLQPKFKSALDKTIVRELMLCANMFIYPTREESFGYIGLENVISGAKTIFLNKDLHMMEEIYGSKPTYINFGSYTTKSPKYKEQWLPEVADIILKKFQSDETTQIATRIRKYFNYNSIYENYYTTILNEVKGIKVIINFL